MENTDFLSILLIAIGLAMDCFAVSLCGSIALKTLSRFQIARTALAFGFFQAMMLALGWLAGQTIVDFIKSFDHWLAFGLLAVIGGKMVWESFHPKRRDKERKKSDLTKGWTLLLLSIATSIDALAVGLSFAFLEINIITACLIVGIASVLITVIGLLLGRKVGEIVGERAELIGGLVLIGIGIRILVTHLAEG